MVYNSGTADEASDVEKRLRKELNITYLSNVGAWHGKRKKIKVDNETTLHTSGT